MPDKLDLARLRATAEAAPANRIVFCSHGLDRTEMRFLAAFSPPTVLALLDELEAARALVDHLNRYGFVPSDYARELLAVATVALAGEPK